MRTEHEQVRVLIVDNDHQVLESLAASLIRRHYHVRTLLGGQPDIHQQIKEIAWQYRPHVIVLDLRLKNEYMTDDETGLELISHFPNKLCILISAWLTSEVTQNALEAGAFRCVRKGPGQTQILINTIHDAAQSRSIRTTEQRITWLSNWSGEKAATYILGPEYSSTADIVDDLLFQLFDGDLERLQIAPLVAARFG